MDNLYKHSTWCDCEICNNQAEAIGKFREEVFKVIDNNKSIDYSDKLRLKREIDDIEEAIDNN